MVQSQTTSITPAQHAARHVIGGEDPLIDPLFLHASRHIYGGADAVATSTIVDTQVYDAAKANAWQNLDLSAVVGLGNGIALMLVENDTGGAAGIRFRPDSRTENINVDASYSSASGVYLANGVNGKGIVIAPYIAGITEWISSNAGGTVTLTVLAFW